MEASFGDNVRIVSTPLTVSLGFAGLRGEVRGETTPSVMGMEVIGELTDDYAINVHLDERDESHWFAPELVELIDHAPGTEFVIGDQRFTRAADGSWLADRPQKPWWRFW